MKRNGKSPKCCETTQHGGKTQMAHLPSIKSSKIIDGGSKANKYSTTAERGVNNSELSWPELGLYSDSFEDKFMCN